MLKKIRKKVKIKIILIIIPVAKRKCLTHKKISKKWKLNWKGKTLVVTNSKNNSLTITIKMIPD